MIYPVLEPFMANSILITIIAILHVFVSHFAIGGGLYLVLAESRARRKNDQDHLACIEKHSRFFILVTLVSGAATAIGTWMAVGLIHPTGVKSLIDNLVWGWVALWVFFVIAIAAAIIYYYGWRRLLPKTHLAVGWIFFAAALLSLAVINGILTFTLTPSRWIESISLWEGFFNPVYWPSLIFRTSICLVLAGLFANLTIAKEKKLDLKIRIMRINGILILASLILSVPAGLWYFNSLPEDIAAGLIPCSTPATALQVMLFSSAVLFLLTLFGTIIFPRRSGYISAAILLLCALLAIGGFELARESARKPYVIYGFLYGNNLPADDAAAVPAGYLRSIANIDTLAIKALLSKGEKGNPN
jgi:cytochrome bd-type quinol oxidase subunit 1